MKISILIGGRAGQGINKVSSIISGVLVKYGYFAFSYRDYPSIIRGGHNFNLINFSDKRIGSIESKVDVIIALDGRTSKIHRNELKKGGLVLDSENFIDFGININLAMAGAILKICGIPKNLFLSEIKKIFNNPSSLKASEKGYDSQKVKFKLKKLKNKIEEMSGSKGIAIGARNSKINLYIAYPMTPATGVINELAKNEIKNNLMVFQPENEISVVNSALGASFTGAKVMIGSSGGGVNLMSEGLSFQGMSEIPLVLYFAMRAGPGTGVPTYNSQGDLNDALREGHGEFPRILIAPGDPIEAIEKTNEAFYLSEKFSALSIILGDKNLAESEFSFDRKPNKILKIKVNRKVPGESIVKASSYEHDEFGNTTENAEITKKNAEARLERYKNIQKECKKFQMVKIYGKKSSKNLVISWGSNKTVILDAISNLDVKFLHVIYLKPFSNEVRKEIKKAKRILVIEQNSTGQLGRLIREKTGIKIKDRILKYDGRPFFRDKLKEEIIKKLK